MEDGSYFSEQAAHRQQQAEIRTGGPADRDFLGVYGEFALRACVWLCELHGQDTATGFERKGCLVHRPDNQ